MGDSGGGGREAVAQALLEVVEAYGLEVDRLVRLGWDMGSYGAAAELFGQMRQHAAALPSAGAAWIEVLISRFEFAQMLWESRGQRLPPGQLSQCHARHAAALRKLADACRGACLH